MINNYLDGVNRPTALEIKVAVVLLFMCASMIPLQAHADPGTLVSSILVGTTVKPEPTFYSGICNPLVTAAIPNGAAWSIREDVLYRTGTSGAYANVGGGTVGSNPGAGGSNGGDYICNIANGVGNIDASGFPDGYYAYIISNVGVPASPADPSIFFITFRVDSGTIVPTIVSGDTAIYSVDPADGDEIATTSLPYDFTTIGNINIADWKEGIRLRIKVDRNTDQQAVGALSAFNSATGNYTYIDIPVESGAFVISTTTLNTLFPISRTGVYRMTQDIETPGLGVHWWIFNYDFSYNTLVSTTTTFTIGTSTAVDNITQNAANYLSNIASSTSQGDPLANCQFSWFSSAIDFSLGGKLINCMGGLSMWALVPPQGAISASFTQVRDGVLTRAPWGYATRLITVFSDASLATTTATSTIQDAAFTVPVYLTGTSSPDTTLTFNPGDMLDGGAALLNGIKANGTSKNMKDIMEPYIILFIAISVLILIFHDLMHMGHTSK